MNDRTGDANAYTTVNTCEHGHLARKCELCELEERAAEKSGLIQDLTQACCNKNVEIAKLKAEVARLRRTCRASEMCIMQAMGYIKPETAAWRMLKCVRANLI